MARFLKFYLFYFLYTFSVGVFNYAVLIAATPRLQHGSPGQYLSLGAMLMVSSALIASASVCLTLVGALAGGATSLVIRSLLGKHDLSDETGMLVGGVIGSTGLWLAYGAVPVAIIQALVSYLALRWLSGSSATPVPPANGI
jgi:hypothetical protein